MLVSKLHQKLLERAENNSLRSLSISKGKIDFFSNDYLGLAKSTALAEDIVKECNQNGPNLNGSTGSRLLSGNSNYTIKVEEYLAELFKAEKALIMNSGYNANLSLLSSIPQKGDTILYDELIHASLKDGYRLSFASRFPFRHNDLNDLELKLKKSTGDVFIVIESFYSMDGDAAPLKEIVELCSQYGAHIILDEAHSTGIRGENGNGLACELQIENKLFARVHTFGKGMGIHGACVVGSKILIDYLINFARPFIYTTALPLHCIASIKCSFDFVKKQPGRVERLNANISLFKALIAETKFSESDYIKSDSPIQVIKVSGNNLVKKMALTLQKNNLDIRPILSPTVKAGEERLRICLHEYNNKEEIEFLVQSIKELK